MASLLQSHLEQISLCASSIAELPFPGCKSFTNALLGQHDITALIRDTEAHERALFHLAPPSLPSRSAAHDIVSAPSTGPAASTTSRRATIYGSRQPKNKAVAAVLGGDLYQRTRHDSTSARQRDEVDLEVLLEGVEKLLAVYAVPGGADRMAQLRRRHQQLAANISHYEALVKQQSVDLARMNQPAFNEHDDEELLPADIMSTAAPIPMAQEDFEREEAEIQELERKKKVLEDRVTGLERDLGGLMR